jgi:hypothetical protein
MISEAAEVKRLREALERIAPALRTFLDNSPRMVDPAGVWLWVRTGRPPHVGINAADCAFVLDALAAVPPAPAKAGEPKHGQAVGGPVPPGLYDTGGNVDSIGRCEFCGYAGPGPRHYCSAPLAARAPMERLQPLLVALARWEADYKQREGGERLFKLHFPDVDRELSIAINAALAPEEDFAAYAAMPVPPAPAKLDNPICVCGHLASWHVAEDDSSCTVIDCPCHRFRTSSAPVEPANQCDGMTPAVIQPQAAPALDERGRPYMVCQRDRYEGKVKP